MMTTFLVVLLLTLITSLIINFALASRNRDLMNGTSPHSPKTVPGIAEKISKKKEKTPLKRGIATFDYYYKPEYSNIDRIFTVNVGFDILKTFNDTSEVFIDDIFTVENKSCTRSDDGSDLRNFANNIENRLYKEKKLLKNHLIQLQVDTPDIQLTDDDLGALINNKTIKVNEIEIKLKDEHTFVEVMDLVGHYMI